jgi:uncharacterized protein (TIGR03435 family)
MNSFARSALFLTLAISLVTLNRAQTASVPLSSLPPVYPLEFEVASVRLADPGARNDSLYTDRAANLHVESFPLRAIITFAYEIRDFELVGAPGWVGTERYDILAKAPHDAGTGQMPDQKTMTDDERTIADQELRARLRSLLASRFGLVVHHEVRERIVYSLIVAKSGPKLRMAIKPGDQYGFRGGRGGRSQGFGITTAMLANELARITGQPVLDRTGLTAKYDYILEWAPEDDAFLTADSQPAANSGSTIFTALQEQLGLKLESSKGPVDTVVVDSISRPSPN